MCTYNVTIIVATITRTGNVQAEKNNERFVEYFNQYDVITMQLNECCPFITLKD